MLKLFGKSATDRDVLFAGIEKGNVDRLLGGNPLLIRGQDFAPHLKGSFTIAYVVNMAVVRAKMTILNPLRCDVYDHFAFVLGGPTRLHVYIDPFVTRQFSRSSSAFCGRGQGNETVNDVGVDHE